MTASPATPSATTPVPRAETFEHGADVGVRGVGRSREEAFEQAALALFSLVAAGGAVRPAKHVSLICEAPDEVVLLADWLNGLIYEMSVRRLVFGRCRVRIEGDRLEGEAWGEPFDGARHQAGTEPKGATFTAARVAREADGSWCAQCVIDV